MPKQTSPRGPAIKAEIQDRNPEPPVNTVGRVSSPDPFLREAPATLVSLYRRIGRGKNGQVLGRLLTDTRMRRVWAALAKRIQPERTERQWRDLWAEIVRIWFLTKRKGPALKDEQGALRKIARTATELAKLIEEGPVDLPLFYLFPSDVMRLNGVNEWEKLDLLPRSDRAHEFLAEWPMTSEVLKELAARAEQAAHDARQAVPVERTTRGRAAIIFARCLPGYFERQFGRPLYEHAATIAAVVLQRAVKWEFVENTYRRRKR